MVGDRMEENSLHQVGDVFEWRDVQHADRSETILATKQGIHQALGDAMTDPDFDYEKNRSEYWQMLGENELAAR